MTVDVLVAGGGLAGSLVCWRLATLRPELRCCLIEGGAHLGGNHTWSFHDTDLAPGAREWISPLVVAWWPRHEVRFPAGRRVLSGAYGSITSARLHDVIAPVMGERLRLCVRATQLSIDRVTLEHGEEIRAHLVIDARGEPQTKTAAGWQTFVGQELEFEDDHGLQWPILMDATVPQVGGFRFIYVRPFNESTRAMKDHELLAAVRSAPGPGQPLFDEPTRLGAVDEHLLDQTRPEDALDAPTVLGGPDAEYPSKYLPSTTERSQPSFGSGFEGDDEATLMANVDAFMEKRPPRAPGAKHDERTRAVDIRNDPGINDVDWDID